MVDFTTKEKRFFFGFYLRMGAPDRHVWINEMKAQWLNELGGLAAVW